MDNGFNNGYYRLGDIGKLYYSKKWVSHNNGLFPIYGTGGIISLTNKPTFEPNSIILPRVGTLKIYFSSFKHSTKNTAFSYKTKNPKLTKYIYYKLHKIDFLHQNEGSAVPRLTSKYWKSLNIFLPSLSTQQKIIDIIEPHQELYLKFSNCIRIDTYENAKHDMQILIDIIEPIEKLEHTFNKLNNIITNLEAFLFNSIYKSSNHITINKLITISNVKVNSNELELRGVGYSGFVNKSNVNRSKLSKQILEDDFVIGLISKNIPIAFNWEKNKIGVSTAYYVFKPINNPMASWYIYYYLKNKNWKQFVKPTSRHGQAFEVNLFLNNNVKFVFDDYLEKRFNFIFEKIKYLKNKYSFLLNKIINVKQKLIKILII